MANTHSLSFSLDVSPVEFTKLMFEKTDENGNLNLHGWYDVEKDDTTSFKDYSCKIKWGTDSLNFLISNYKKLFEELKIISNHLDELNEMYLNRTNPYIESTNGILKGKQLEATYFIFVAPFEAKTKEQLDSQVIGRVGEELCGYEMIRHAQRLCRLMQLDATETVINNEGRMLIASMAMVQCGVEIKEQIIYGDGFVKIGNYEFNYIETLELLNDKEGKLYYKPQSKYKNTKKLGLHEFGNGEFCKFKLNNAKNISGVYAWVINNEVVYIGEAVDFKKRFNMGYGIISPRNCFEGGQKTNCKMNQVVLNEYKNGNKIDIYFLEIENYKAVEKELLLDITTRYNVKNNKR